MVNLGKRRIKPGTILFNQVSQMIGEARPHPDHPKQLRLGNHWEYVEVRVRQLEGKNRGRYRYPDWLRKNLKIV